MLFDSWRSVLNFWVFILCCALALISVYIYFFYLISPWNLSSSNFPCLCLPVPAFFTCPLDISILDMFERIFTSNSTLLSVLPRKNKTDLSRREDDMELWKLLEHLNSPGYLEEKASAMNKEKCEWKQNLETNEARVIFHDQKITSSSKIILSRALFAVIS